MLRVPLDDALTPRLPPVCVMTGAPADGYAPQVAASRLGLAWLLLLGGPVGAVVLLALLPRLRVRFVVRMPLSSTAFERIHALRTKRLWCVALGVAGIVVGLALRWAGPIGWVVLAAGVLAFAAALAAHLRLPWAEPSLSVDRRGRWLTILGAHAAFVRAVEHRRAR
jgi:hypothetical protein